MVSHSFHLSGSVHAPRPINSRSGMVFTFFHFGRIYRRSELVQSEVLTQPRLGL